MKRLIEAREDPVEELFGKLMSYLVEINNAGFLVPDIVARDIQDACRHAVDIVGRLQDRLIFQRRSF